MAITTEAIRVRTGVVGYARFIIFRSNGLFESGPGTAKLCLLSQDMPVAFSSSNVIIKNIIMSNDQKNGECLYLKRLNVAYSNSYITLFDTRGAGGLPCCGAGGLPCCGAGGLPCCGAGGLPCCGAGGLPCCGAGGLPCWGAGGLPCCGAGGLPCCGAGGLPCCGAGGLPCCGAGGLPCCIDDEIR